MLCLLNDGFQEVKSWLMSSGLFISEKNDKNCGGVFSFFDDDAQPTINDIRINATK